MIGRVSGYSRHLSREELIEGLDRALPADRAAHAETCERCRREMDAVAILLREARDVEAPEPSPLFWEQFSARVREAIDVSPAPVEPRWAARGWEHRGVARLVFAGGAVAAALIVAVLFWRAPQPRPTIIRVEDAVAVGPQPFPTVVREGRPATIAVEGGAPGPASDVDPEWALLVSVADDVDWDTAHEAGLGVRPGAAERAASQLSDAQQVELARLLRAELARPRS